MRRLDKAGVEAKTIRELVILDGKRVLEVGCGTGRVTKILKTGNNFLLAIDPDAEKVKVAEAVVPTAQFLVATIHDLNPETKDLFDIIVFSMSLHHIGLSVAEKWAALQKARQLLRPHGQILVIEPQRSSVVTAIVSHFQPEEALLLGQAAAAMAEFCAVSTGYFFSAELAWQYADRDELIFHFKEILGATQSQALWDGLLDELNVPKENITLVDKITFTLMQPLG